MNTAEAYFDKVLKSARTFLARWNGGDAELRELTISVRRLRVVIRRHDRSGNLLISCLDPASIKAPIQWSNCNLSVTTVSLPNSDELGFRVLDDNEGVEIVCGGLEISENVKLSH